MTYGELKIKVLQLMNQYSIAGGEVALSYNNQADYVFRIPGLINDAMTKITTSVRPLRKVVALSELEHEVKGDYVLYTLPDDCWQLTGGGLIHFADNRMQRFHKYHNIGEKQIAVPHYIKPEVMVEYFRYYIPLPVSPAVPADDLQPDGPVEALTAATYYAAAYLLQYDDPYGYQSCYNEFEDRLSTLVERPQIEMTVVEDAYAPEHDAGWRWGY